MSELPLSKSVGYVAEDTSDRIDCLAMEFGLTREELVGHAMGIGLTVLEASVAMPEARVWVWDGATHGRRIELPLKPETE